MVEVDKYVVRALSPGCDKYKSYLLSVFLLLQQQQLISVVKHTVIILISVGSA